MRGGRPKLDHPFVRSFVRSFLPSSWIMDANTPTWTDNNGIRILVQDHFPLSIIQEHADRQGNLISMI